MMKSYSYSMQSLLASLKDREVRRSMKKFRVGSHWLEIQQGRFTRRDRALRLCRNCGSGSVEDENHMLFQCLFYQHVKIKCSRIWLSGNGLSGILL
jgi:hypothetical protein